ncbi:MAG: aspartate carbamoyltransferase [Candidatus Odinarchaeia archaeon]
MSLKSRDLISIKNITREEIDEIIKTSEAIQNNPEKFKGVLKGRILGALFFEPSTRTRISFESAMKRLGGKVVGFSEPEGSSLAKGENLVDTIRVVQNYCDAILLRHPLEGAAKLASEISDVPIINAGTGAEEHPTQALLDLYTMYKEQGKIDGLTIALMGDLKYGRTINSLSYALSNYDVNLILISPPELKIRKEILEDLNQKGTKYREVENLSEAIKEIDVLYVTRIQKERFPDPTEYEKLKDSYGVTLKELKNAKENLIIMHPLPRIHEISPEIDNTKYAAYFKQVKYGVITRMAILTMVLTPEKPETVKTAFNIS